MNFRNLIRDLADMYPFDVPEVVLTELIANSLDAKPTRIDVDYDSRQRLLEVRDDGAGMNKGQFTEYHDFAAGLKQRGTGIGFAGLGAKISFNVAPRVRTETRSKSFAGCSDWYLNRKGELVWESSSISREGVNGTLVAVHFRPDTDVPYRTRDDLIRPLYKHFSAVVRSKVPETVSETGIIRSN